MERGRRRGAQVPQQALLRRPFDDPAHQLAAQPRHRRLRLVADVTPVPLLFRLAQHLVEATPLPGDEARIVTGRRVVTGHGLVVRLVVGGADGKEEHLHT